MNKAQEYRLIRYRRAASIRTARAINRLGQYGVTPAVFEMLVRRIDRNREYMDAIESELFTMAGI